MAMVAGSGVREREREQGPGLGDADPTARYWRRPTIRRKAITPPRGLAAHLRAAPRPVLSLVIEDDVTSPRRASSLPVVLVTAAALAVTGLMTAAVLARGAATTSVPASTGAHATAQRAAPAALPSPRVERPANVEPAAAVDPARPALPAIDVKDLPAAPRRR
jgi:hypothetical protein